MQACYEVPAGSKHNADVLIVPSLIFVCLQDLDITMTVAGYQSISKDVNRKALKYNPYGIPPPKGDHAKL